MHEGYAAAWTKSLRFQLTAWSLLTVALILLACGVAVLRAGPQALLRETDQALAGAARPDSAADPPTPNPGEADDEKPGRRSRGSCVASSRLAPATLPGIGTDASIPAPGTAGTGRSGGIVAEPDAASPDFLATFRALPPVPRRPVFAGRGDDDRMRCLTVPFPHSPICSRSPRPGTRWKTCSRAC